MVVDVNEFVSTKTTKINKPVRKNTSFLFLNKFLDGKVVP